MARVAKLCETSGLYFDSKGIKKLEAHKKGVSSKLDKYDFAGALEYIWRSDIKWGLRWFDQLINEDKPWQLKDKKLLELKLILYVLNIRNIAYNLKPFLPETAEKIEKQFKGPKIKSAESLFPRIK